MNKLEYELNQVAQKAAEEAAKKVKKEDVVKTIKMLKRRDCTSDEILQEILQSYGDELSHDEIKQLVKENC